MVRLRKPIYSKKVYFYMLCVRERERDGERGERGREGERERGRERSLG
jgi:hypothetical protein